jgi:hypothetical protein
VWCLWVVSETPGNRLVGPLHVSQYAVQQSSLLSNQRIGSLLLSQKGTDKASEI